MLPRLTRVLSAFRHAGATLNWLHTAGPTASILPLYVQAGVDLANIDFCVDPLEAMQRLPRTCLNGNLRPLAFVDSQPEEIAEASAALLTLFAERGGFILSSGCEIPLEAKPENIAAMILRARQEH